MAIIVLISGTGHVVVAVFMATLDSITRSTFPVPSANSSAGFGV